MRIGIFKRITGWILVMLIMITVMPTVPASAQSAEDMLNDIKKTYPVGSYFVGNGYSYDKNGNKIGNLKGNKKYPCTHKGNYDGYFKGGWQCKGFANYVFYRMFNLELPSYNSTYRYKLLSSKNVEVVGILTAKEVNKASVKNLLADAKTGDMIQAQRTGSQHSMIFVSSDSKGFTVYDGNYPSECRVNQSYWTWETFAKTRCNEGISLNRASNYDKLYPSNHTHKWVYNSESKHPHKEYRTCSSCGLKLYTGENELEDTCKSCYPLTIEKFKRSYQKTLGTVTFSWTKVKNATNYSIQLYKDGVKEGNPYTPSKEDIGNKKMKLPDKLASGTYKAELTISNSNTGEKKTVKCDNFTMVNTYSVKYNANGGKGVPSAQTKIHGTTLTLSSAVPDREGYVFQGWSTSKNATSAQYSAGGQYTKNTNSTLYAIWAPKTCTVVFDANNSNGESQTQTVTYGNILKMPNSVVKDGYYLEGWAKSRDSQTPDYTIGMDYVITSDMTIYAVWGQGTWDNGTEPFSGGDGTEANPYQIANSKQLAYLANKVNTQSTIPSYEYYILTDNIDLGYNEWIPIGRYNSQNRYFKGCFNGNGYTISNLSIKNAYSGCIGLFGYTKDSEIKNLTVSGAINGIDATGVLNAGIIAGASENLIANDCIGTYVNISGISSSVTTEDSNIGTLFGTVSGGAISNCIADNCYAAVTKGMCTLGMIAGRVNGNITGCSVISKSVLFRSTTGTSSGIEQIFCGGIAGSVTGTVKECSVNAEYLGMLETIGKLYVGGIVGWHEEGNIELCSVYFSNGTAIEDTTYKASIYANSKSASGSTDYAQAGGISGMSKITSVISDCKYDGKSIYAKNATRNAYAGGIVGNDNGLSTLALTGANRCFSNVDGVVYADSARTAGAGGIFGRIGVSTSVAASATNLLTKADKIVAQTSGSTYTAYAGYISGILTNGGYKFDNVWSFSDLKLAAVNTTNPTNISESEGIKTIPDYQIKNADNVKQIFGEPYESVADLTNNPENVWILEKDKYPELYFTALHNITVSDTEHGHLTVDKTKAATVQKDFVTVSAEPDEGYVLNKIYVNGEGIVGTTFIANDDSNVYATFTEKPEKFNITVETDENATAELINLDDTDVGIFSLFSVDTTFAATDGEEIQVNAEASEDYTVDAIYVNGEEITGDSFIVSDNSVVALDVLDISTDAVAVTYDAEDISEESVTLGGKVSGEDEGLCRYILYWKVDEPETIFTTEIEEGGGEYSVTVTDLKPFEEYEYQMTEFGEIKSFISGDMSILTNKKDEENDIVQRTICFEIQNELNTTETVTADIVNISEESQSGLVIFASYDNNNALIQIETQDIEDLEANDIFPIEFDLLEGADKYKILVWGSLKTMIPVASSVNGE